MGRTSCKTWLKNQRCQSKKGQKTPRSLLLSLCETRTREERLRSASAGHFPAASATRESRTPQTLQEMGLFPQTRKTSGRASRGEVIFRVRRRQPQRLCRGNPRGCPERERPRPPSATAAENPRTAGPRGRRGPAGGTGRGSSGARRSGAPRRAPLCPGDAARG